MSLIFRIEKKEQAVNQKGNKKKEKKKGLIIARLITNVPIFIFSIIDFILDYILIYCTSCIKITHSQEEVEVVVEGLVSCPPGPVTFKIGSPSSINSMQNIKSILVPERGSLYRLDLFHLR